MKSIVILKSVSGAGKTTVSKLFKDATIICADDFFTRQDGSYHFDGNLIGRAHINCRYLFDLAIKKETETIVIANTNTKPSDWIYYETEGLKNDYKVFHLVVENRHGNKDCHSVPGHVLDRQEQALKQNLKLR